MAGGERDRDVWDFGMVWRFVCLVINGECSVGRKGRGWPQIGEDSMVGEWVAGGEKEFMCVSGSLTNICGRRVANYTFIFNGYVASLE